MKRSPQDVVIVVVVEFDLFYINVMVVPVQVHRGLCGIVCPQSPSLEKLAPLPSSLLVFVFVSLVSRAGETPSFHTP